MEMSEEILGIFPANVLTKTGLLLGGWGCKLVFTTDRLIMGKTKKNIALTIIRPDYIASLATTRDRLKMKEMSIEDILKDIEYHEIISHSKNRK